MVFEKISVNNRLKHGEIQFGVKQSDATVMAPAGKRIGHKFDCAAGVARENGLWGNVEHLLLRVKWNLTSTCWYKRRPAGGIAVVVRQPSCIHRQNRASPIAMKLTVGSFECCVLHRRYVWMSHFTFVCMQVVIALLLAVVAVASAAPRFFILDDGQVEGNISVHFIRFTVTPARFDSFLMPPQCVQCPILFQQQVDDQIERWRRCCDSSCD